MGTKITKTGAIYENSGQLEFKLGKFYSDIILKINLKKNSSIKIFSLAEANFDRFNFQFLDHEGGIEFKNEVRLDSNFIHI